MKAFVAAPIVQSRSIGRVAEALAKYAPSSVGIVTNERDADLVVLHVIGRRDRMLSKAQTVTRAGQRYAVVQYVLKSTQKPRALDWHNLWAFAACVWSYLDLPAALAEDWDEVSGGFGIPFYHAPLGVEADVFTFAGEHEMGLMPFVMTTGQSWLTESVREVAIAAQRVGAYVVHLGPNIGHGLTCVTDIPDRALMAFYRRCDFVSGLRRIEGFELPAAEGLLCGARPIMFNLPCYRSWYDGGLAEFIEETDRDGVIDQLEVLFRRGARPVTAEERAIAVKRFHWPTIIRGFWDRVLA